MRKLLISFSFLILISYVGVCQSSLKTSLFVRSIHLYNQNLTESSSFYSPNPSIGMTLSYCKAFADFGVFINKSDQPGFYTFIGSLLHLKPLSDNWAFTKSWFSELTYIPSQGETSGYWIQTAGGILALNKALGWGSLSVPLTCGLAHSDGELSINFRLVFNISVPIK